MNLPEYITKEEVQRVCAEIGLRDWTQLSEPVVELKEAQIIQTIIGNEAAKIPVNQFRTGLEVELEHGIVFPDANVTNNHPLLTGMIVLAHLKEMLDYYLRLEVAELDGDLFKALQKGNADKLLSVYRKLIKSKAELVDHENSSIA